VVPWPYVEALRMDEAMHPVALIATGIYGKSLLNQNGAPLRLVVPWKYGFKGGKSIVKIRFTESQPATTWNLAAADEYGFFANVTVGALLGTGLIECLDNAGKTQANITYINGDPTVALQEVLSTPVLLVVLWVVLTVAGLVHEIGHATACRYGGAEPGAIGVGVYLLFPFFDGMATQGRVIQAESDLARQRIDSWRAQDNVTFEARVTVDAVREAMEIVRALSGTVEQARRLLAMAEQGYSLGVKTQIEVDDAQVEVRQAEGNLAKAKRDYRVALVNLDWVRGRL